MPPQHQQQGMGKLEKVPVKADTNGLLQNGLDKIATGNALPFSNYDREFDSSGDNNKTDQLAKQLMTSAVVNCGGGETSITAPIINEHRIDYTEEVKRKYFDPQENHEKIPSQQYSPLPRIEGTHNNNIDEGVPSKIIANDLFLPATSQISLSSGITGFHSKPSSDNEMINKIRGGEYGTRTKACRPHTPPLTLYANEGIPPSIVPSRAAPDTPNNDDDGNPNTEELAGHLSPGPGMDVYSVGQSAHMPHAVSITPNLISIPDLTPQVGSVSSAASSRGSMSTATNSLIKQPLLYSAIGSLEHINGCNSLTNLNKRFMAPSKEFCQPGGSTPAAVPSTLIPPARQYEHRTQEPRKTSHKSSLRAELSKPGAPNFEKDQVDAAASPTKPGDFYIGTDEKDKPSAEENDFGDEIPGDTNSSITTRLPVNSKSCRRERSGRRPQTGGDAPTNDNAIATNNTNNNEHAKSRRDSQNSIHRKAKSNKKVSYDESAKAKKTKSKTVEMFRPSSDAYTPRIERKKIKYKAAEARPSVQQMSSPMGTLQRPNFRDALRRVAMIIHQHIVKIESRFEQQGLQYNQTAPRVKGATNDGLFHASMRDMFNEDAYRTPTYKCNMARIPMARPGMIYGLRRIKVMYTIPSETEIYDFGHQLFKSVQLSSECSIVCLIYVERLMEVAKVPLLACTWRPIFMCGLLLASKVWQDLSSWNIEFSSVYPQFSLEAINKLELNFLRNVKWDLYISSR